MMWLVTDSFLVWNDRHDVSWSVHRLHTSVTQKVNLHIRTHSVSAKVLIINVLGQRWHYVSDTLSPTIRVVALDCLSHCHLLNSHLHTLSSWLPIIQLCEDRLGSTYFCMFFQFDLFGNFHDVVMCAFFGWHRHNEQNANLFSYCYHHYIDIAMIKLVIILFTVGISHPTMQQTH